MARLARAGSRKLEIRNKAVEITTAGFLNGTGLRQKDFDGEARRLLEFTRDDIRYVRDIAGVETLHDPVTLLKLGAGDCDDKAILLAALLMSVGHDQLRYVAIALEPGQFSHVWLQDRIYDRWVDLEPTEPIPYGSSVPVKGAAKIITQDV
jgi:hypothetical protein